MVSLEHLTPRQLPHELISDLHDLFMILYLILTLPWMLLSTLNATSTKTRRRR